MKRVAALVLALSLGAVVPAVAQEPTSTPADAFHAAAAQCGADLNEAADSGATSIIRAYAAVCVLTFTQITPEPCYLRAWAAWWVYTMFLMDTLHTDVPDSDGMALLVDLVTRESNQVSC